MEKKNFEFKLVKINLNIDFVSYVARAKGLGKYSSMIWSILSNYIRLSHYHHHHLMPRARISLTLSRHFSLSFIASGRSSRLHPVSLHSGCTYVRAGRPAFARPYVGVHRIHHLWARPCFSMSGSSSLDSFRDGRQVTV